MPPALASIIYKIGILGLFYLDRDKKTRISLAAWLPALWLFLISSRSASFWLGVSVPNFSAVDATQAYEEGSPVDRNIFTLLLIVALVVLIARSRRVGPLLQNNGLLLAYFSFCLFSILWSDYSLVAFKRWTKELGDMGMVLILLTESDPFTALRQVLTRLGFLLFPLSILYIKYFPAIGRRLTMSWTLEPIGVATQKNELGVDCSMYGVLFVWILISTYRDRSDPARRRRLLAHGTIVGMVIWLLNQCNSTTSITALVSAGLVVWLAGRRSQKPWVVHLLVVAVLSLAVTALFLDSSGGMVEALGKDPSLTGRTDIWKLVLSLHTNPLVGTGFESFWLGPRLTFLRNALPNFPINEAHNGYLEVYLNLGWAGLCFIALLIGTAYIRMLSGFRQDPARRSLFIGFFLCSMFYSFSEAGFRLMTVSWFFLLLVIAGVAHVGKVPGKDEGRLRGSVKAEPDSETSGMSWFPAPEPLGGWAASPAD